MVRTDGKKTKTERSVRMFRISLYKMERSLFWPLLYIMLEHILSVTGYSIATIVMHV